MELPLTDEVRAIARRIVWFEEPEVSTANLPRFLAYAFRYATHDDMTRLRQHLSDDDLRAALEAAPPGIIDGRSWAFWRLRLDLPDKSMPVRRIPAGG